MTFIAQDTFSVELRDGSSLLVTKGSPFPDKHEVVQLDQGRGLLFKPLDDGSGAAPEPKPAAKLPARKGG